MIDKYSTFWVEETTNNPRLPVGVMFYMIHQKKEIRDYSEMIGIIELLTVQYLRNRKLKELLNGV